MVTHSLHGIHVQSMVLQKKKCTKCGIHLNSFNTRVDVLESSYNFFKMFYIVSNIINL